MIRFSALLMFLGLGGFLLARVIPKTERTAFLIELRYVWMAFVLAGLILILLWSFSL